jgi:hypothetical protein
MSVEASYIEDLEIDLERAQMLAADLRARLAAVEDLVRHCWVHNVHEDCGWKQMDAQMKRLYQEVIKPDCKPADAGPDTRQTQASAAESPGTSPGGS